MARSASPNSAAQRTDSTPDRILAAAEQLFADEGIDRVTLRQIARASGQGNVAAVQYHFGGKDALVASITLAHQQQIDARRKTLLAEHDLSDVGNALPRLLEILVAPLVEKLDEPSGRAYLRIQTQRVSRDGMQPATRTLARRITAALGDMPSDPLRDRFAVLLMFQALSDRARAEAASNAQPRSRTLFTRALVRALHGLYTGPPV